MNQSLSEEEIQLLALQFVDGLGVIKSNLLLRHFGSAQAIFNASRKDLQSFGNGIHDKIIDQIISRSTFSKIETELRFCAKNHIDIISAFHPDYPARLQLLEDKPHILFKKGNIHPQIKKSLAIVGTRKSTEYGHRFLENLFEELKTIKDIAIVSGLALGIDCRAHALSVKHKIPTIGVMGLALDKIYPSQNTNIAKSILMEEGGWMTETTSQDKMSQGVFPRRNRLIAGMCDAMLIVETDIKGGSVITALLANDYGKEVFALPGRITDAQSRGCNDLIQKNLAQIVNNPKDMIEFMSWNLSSNKKIPAALELDFEGSDIQKCVLNAIRIHPKIELEKLMEYTQLNRGKLVETLLDLELEGMIITLPGNKYELI